VGCRYKNVVRKKIRGTVRVESERNGKKLENFFGHCVLIIHKGNKLYF